MLFALKIQIHKLYYLIYICTKCYLFLNVQGYGDSKFIPGIEKERLEQLLKLSPIWDKLQPLWDGIRNEVYDLSPGRTCLGYPPHGCTTYLSKNCSPEDNERVQKWMKSQKLQAFNNRLFKTEAENKVTSGKLFLLLVLLTSLL